LKTGALRDYRRSSVTTTVSIIVSACFFLFAAGVAAAWGKFYPEPLPKAESGWFVDMDLFSRSAHVGISCEECHGLMNTDGKSHPDTTDSPNFLKKRVKRLYDYRQCQKCRKIAYERYATGEHAVALEKEKKSGTVSKTGYAPTCGDCHSAHYSKSHLSRAETGKRLTEVCGSCHADQKASFLSNFHGKMAVHLGYDKSAFCTDCHGAHACSSLKDRKAALKTCQRCHPDAGPNFADVVIHDSFKNMDQKSDEKRAGLQKIRIFGLLSFCVVSFLLVLFYGHSFLLMLRKIHEQLRKHK
jgi:hypothetical protein